MDMKPLEPRMEDLEDILVLQKTAYLSEAEIHDDFSIPPLHQTLDQIKEEFQNQKFLKIERGGRIIASVRACEINGTCYIGKLIVDPSFQNQGIGSCLLTEIEHAFQNVKRFELFTGYKSERNLYFYSKNGYKAFKKAKQSEKLTLVYLEKQNVMSK